MNIFKLIFLILIIKLKNSFAWDSEQLEVFDVVDEIKTNFYDLLNISQNASSQEIRSAFRLLTLKLHPDKNLETDTSKEFRNLVSVYDIIKNPAKRKYYDEILLNGLPNWRSAVYYYRYVRKVGILEACIILFIIITIGQYIVNWAAYYEKKFTIQEILKRKRSTKKSKAVIIDEEIVLPKPTFYQTLPFQLPKFLWFILISTPSALGLLKSALAQQIEEATKKPPSPEPEPEPVVRIKTIRKRNKFTIPEGPNFETSSSHGSVLNKNAEKNSFTNNSAAAAAAVIISGGLWTDDDLDELVRLVKKFPQGSAKRWESIAEALNRSVPEVTYMANKLKDNGYRLTAERKQQEEEEEISQQVKIKPKTKKNGDLNNDENSKNNKWSQVQQKALEEGLIKYSKGVLDRWDKISDHVPGKSKEECMLRFKYISEMLKKNLKDVETEKCDADADDNKLE